MRKGFIILGIIQAAICLCPSVARAQQDNSVLKFEEVVWDFGRIRETDGPVSHVFRFTNTSSGAIVIERVTSDCGCTTPRYSKEPVRPGREGTLEVVFDPANYWGEFNKNITVISNGGKSRNDIKVKGTVQERERSVEERYPYSMQNGLRLDNLRLAFDYVPAGSAKSMTVGLVNTSNKEIRIMASVEHGSGYLRVDLPRTLKPGEEGTATFSYIIPAASPAYGMTSDRVRISANGASGGMGVTAHAIVIDDFTTVDKSKAPSCELKPTFYNFGRAAAGTVLEKGVTVTNTGVSPLIIRSVTPRAGCTCDLKAGTVIVPGKSMGFRVTMDTEGMGGIRTGGVTIIVNDPERPMRDIRTAVEVTK